MPIITSSPALNSIVKGSPATFTLSKADLLLVPSVAGDAYYSDSSNWKAVVLNYMSSPLNQPEIVGFDATQVSPTGIFEVVTSALDVFNIQSISIIDFQGGVFTVPRSELTVSEFDVDMGAPSFPFIRDFSSPSFAESYEVGTTTISSNTMNVNSGGTYINQNPDIDYVLGQSYTFRIYPVSANIGTNITVYSSGSHNVGSVTGATVVAAIGTYFDVTFIANASDVGSLTKMFLIFDASAIATFSKVEFIQNP